MGRGPGEFQLLVLDALRSGGYPRGWKSARQVAELLQYDDRLGPVGWPDLGDGVLPSWRVRQVRRALTGLERMGRVDRSTRHDHLGSIRWKARKRPTTS